jgi:hypothetical protein
MKPLYAGGIGFWMSFGRNRQHMKILVLVDNTPAVVHALLRGYIHAIADKYEVTVICNSAEKNSLATRHSRLISAIDQLQIIV